MSGTIPIYRFYRKDNKDHFYSKNIKQKNIWKPQGIEFYAVSPIDYKIQSINTMGNQNKVGEEYQKQISFLQKEYDELKIKMNDDEVELKEEFSKTLDKEVLKYSNNQKEWELKESRLKGDYEKSLDSLKYSYEKLEKHKKETLKSLQAGLEKYKDELEK